MPQLDPGPWMLIWMSSWLIFIVTMPALILMFKPFNSPTNKLSGKTPNPWNWPWL